MKTEMKAGANRVTSFPFLLFRIHCPVVCAPLTTQRGSLSRAALLFFGVLLTALVTGTMLASDRGVDENAEQAAAPLILAESTDPVTGGRRYTVSIPVEGAAKKVDGDIWKILQEALKVERIAPSEENPRQRARAAARRDFRELNQVIQELRRQGLEGEELLAGVENRFIEANDEGALKMLDGYRRLQEDLASADLEGTSPEDRFAYLVRARRDAFGKETAEDLFFENEAYTQHKLEEKAIVQDTGLSEAEKQTEIIGRRNALQVDLASRGSYVSFADERHSELDRRLRERYGKGVGALSEEERRAAILDLYRGELPPETLEKVEQVLAAQAARRSAFEAYRSESEAILNDQDLSFDEKQERLAELSAQYDASPSGAGL